MKNGCMIYLECKDGDGQSLIISLYTVDVVTEVVGNTIHINMHQLFRKSRRSMVVDLYINIPQNLSKSKILASKGYALNQHMLLKKMKSMDGLALYSLVYQEWLGTSGYWLALCIWAGVSSIENFLCDNRGLGNAGPQERN